MRNMFVASLKKAGFVPYVPQGAYYLLANFAQLGWKDSRTAATELLRRARIASVPGTAFHQSPIGDTMIRFCFAKDDDVLEEACRRIESLAGGVQPVAAKSSTPIAAKPAAGDGNGHSKKKKKQRRLEAGRHERRERPDIPVGGAPEDGGAAPVREAHGQATRGQVAVPGYDPIVFQNPDFVLADGFLVASYYLEVAAATDLVKKAGDIAVGQTTGGWLELPRATRDVTERAVGRVLSVTEVPPYEDRRPIPENEPRRAVVRIAFPVDNFGADLGALLVAVYGKVSLDGAIKLVDLELPPALVAKLPGPKHGIAGIRKMLDAPERPLTMSIFKPTLGLAPEALADMIGEQAAGGIDLVKDDEVLTDATVDAALKRIDLCRKAAKKARPDGAGVLHAVSLTGPADELVSRARRLSAEGAGALLFNTLAYGLPLMAAIAKDPGVTAPLMAHPALAGGMALEAQHGIAAHLLLGKLMRLAGADLVLFPSPSRIGRLNRLMEKSRIFSFRMVSRSAMTFSQDGQSSKYKRSMIIISPPGIKVRLK